MNKGKNWIKFCDVSSESIPGLIINELPPIQMTPKRVKKIEIEGRDGDIVEELGYMSYDKPIQMSLTEGYDIDKVFGWLNNSGKLILSNEPNKVYTAAVYDTVAFERLVKFKTATVKFHVQPFKKFTEDWAISYADTTGNLKEWARNEGNIYSYPIIEAKIGTVNWFGLYLKRERDDVLGTYDENGNINVYFDKEEGKTYSAIIDCEKVKVTIKDNEGVDVPIKHLHYSGKLILAPGDNQVHLERYGGFEGDMTEMKISNMSRWL